MPVYKLSYFPIKGITEPIRLLFSYAGIDFIDERIDGNDWSKIRPTTPFGQVPVLEVDGKKIHQSIAICIYLAKQCGLYGKNDFEALEIDTTVDNIYDLYFKAAPNRLVDHPEAKIQVMALVKKLGAFDVEKLDEQVKNNGGYFVNGKLTYVDIVFVGLYDIIVYNYKENIFEKAKNLMALREKVLAISSIKAWVDKRPVTDH